MFVWSAFLSVFIVILGDFSEAKFIRGISLIFSSVIWFYVPQFINWCQKDKWNSLEGSQASYTIGKAIAMHHNGRKENNTFNKLLLYD